MAVTKAAVIIATFCALGTAAPVIEYLSTSTGGQTGSISYDPRYGVGGGPGGIGSGGTALGKNIDIDFLKGTGTAINDGLSAMCFSCVLDFQTGVNISDSSSNGDTWSFAGGGYFRVTGGLDLNNDGVLNGGDIQPGTVLLAGVFNSPVTVTTPGGPDLKFTSATLINTMDTRVNALFGVPGPSVYDGYYTQSFDSARARLNPNVGNVNYDRWRFTTYGPTASPTGMMDGSVVNTLVVPEPVSGLLSGTAAGVLALCIRLRRRRAA